MFTGIIEEVGKIAAWNSEITMVIECQKVLEGVQLGDSISVNGVCLTVTEFSNSSFSCDVSEETKARWAPGNYALGARVNLERALAAGARLGGHFVSGHVDGVGQVREFTQIGDFYRLSLKLPSEMERFMVEKGSIAVDGISLTVNQVEGSRVDIMLVPHTLSNTCLGDRKLDDHVNIEADLLGKYVLKQLSYLNSQPVEPSSLDLETLRKAGFSS